MRPSSHASAAFRTTACRASDSRRSGGSEPDIGRSVGAKITPLVTASHTPSLALSGFPPPLIPTIRTPTTRLALPRGPRYKRHALYPRIRIVGEVGARSESDLVRRVRSAVSNMLALVPCVARWARVPFETSAIPGR